jgi:DNA-binding transcriptional regulator YdaS (Cro superfamily)
MTRYIHPGAEKSPDTLQAEQEAAEALTVYFERGLGHQAMLVRATGIPAPVLCKMGKGRYPVSLEQAMLIDLASNGELKAEQLCPSRAALLATFMLQRAVAVGKSS